MPEHARGLVDRPASQPRSRRESQSHPNSGTRLRPQSWPETVPPAGPQGSQSESRAQSESELGAQTGSANQYRLEMGQPHRRPEETQPVPPPEEKQPQAKARRMADQHPPRTPEQKAQGQKNHEDPAHPRTAQLSAGPGIPDPPVRARVPPMAAGGVVLPGPVVSRFACARPAWPSIPSAFSSVRLRLLRTGLFRPPSSTTLRCSVRARSPRPSSVVRSRLPRRAG